jgi:hypothetical protein
MLMPTQSWSADPEVQLGIAGTWKLGFPTRLKVNSSEGGSWEFTTVDGDGVTVIYKQTPATDKPASDSIEMLVQNGRVNQPMKLQLRSSEGTSTLDYELPVAVRGQAVPATQTWVVGVGSVHGIDSLASRLSGSSLSSFTYSVIEKAADLPVHSQAYAGVDLMTISTSNIDLLRQSSVEQSNAIVEWVKQGGRVIVAVGANADEVRTINWLSDLLPGPIVARADSVSGGPVESWIGSSKRIEPLQCARIEPVKSTVDIQLQSLTRDPVPFIVRRVVGLGQVIFVATDLDQGAMAKWEDRGAFLKRLLPLQWEQWLTQGEVGPSASSYLGFDDLSGQLRATLDVFPEVKNSGLTFMAMLLVAFLLLIGPFDYFVMVRFFKKPSATWWTLVLCSILASAGIAWISTTWKPKSAAINDCTVWDVDFETKQAIGRSWLHVYSGTQEKYDLQVVPKPFWKTADQPIAAHVDWMGLPGKGLGGFDSSVSADRGMPSYGISIADAGCNEVQGVGIPLAGTKAIQARWIAPFEVDTTATKLGLVPGSDLLDGEWVNPLPVDLHNPVILFRNWQYTLPTRVQPGQKISLSISVIPKDFARQLQRRRIVDGTEKGNPWQALERNDLSRLIEMMLFHRAAGGTGYTVLSHRYLQQLDMSELIRLNRAIVYGRIDQPTTEVRSKVDGNERELQNGTRQNWIRMIVPVETNPKSDNSRG